MLRPILVLAAVAAITLVLIPVQWISIVLALPTRRSIPVLYHRMLCALIGVGLVTIVPSGRTTRRERQRPNTYAPA